MAYQSVVSHQVRSSFRAIRADYVAICKDAKDPVCAALLLDLAEAWTNHKLDKIKDETIDGLEIEDDLWFYRSEQKIKEDLFNAYGINKLRDNRQWLVSQGLLECKQIPRENGGFTNQYRLNIEAVQAKIDALAPVKNNARSKQDHTLKITDAPVKNNAIRDITKESKDKSSEKDQELETMITLVKKELKQYKEAEKLANALLGRLKGKQAQYNLDTPITDKDLLEFVAWWDRSKKDRNGMSLTRPRNLGSAKSNIQEWLDTRVVKQSPAVKPSDTTNAAFLMGQEIMNILGD